jgi:NADH:ubiquinone oxidoreductase subunit K
MTITPAHFIGVSLLLFGIGLVVVLSRRNAIAMIMGVELMLNAVNVGLVTFDRVYGPASLDGQLFAIFVITVAAAEAVVGLALVLSEYRARGTVAVDEMAELRG